MTRQEIERRIGAIKRRLAALGPMHPGSISEQYNVCGTPGCRCKDPVDPRRHGPYHQLSFTWRGKSSSRFIRPERLAEMRARVANYREMRELVGEWVDLSMEIERLRNAERREAKA